MLMSHMRMVAFTWPFSFLSDARVFSATLKPFGMCLLAELGYVQGVCLTWMDCNLLNKQTAIQSQGSTPSWQGLWLALI